MKRNIKLIKDLINLKGDLRIAKAEKDDYGVDYITNEIKNIESKLSYSGVVV